MKTKHQQLLRVSIFSLSLIMAVVSSGEAAQLLNMRHHSGSDQTRIVLDLSDSASYVVETSDSNTFRIRLMNCAIASLTRNWQIDDGRMGEVTLSEPLRGSRIEVRTVVVTVTMKKSTRPHLFTMANPDRIIIDFAATSTTGQPYQWGGIGTDLLLTKVREEAKDYPLLKRRIRRIVLDPGHGGFDSGAVNEAMKLYEKDVNLQLALTLKTVIEEKGKGEFQVFLTRTGDYYITLSDRAVIANQYQADLFISIHCNAHRNRNANGFEVYFASKQASDREAAEVAQRENLLSLTDPFFAEDNTIDIESILKNLQRQQYLKESRSYATTLHRTVDRQIPIRVRPVKSANFFVLRFAQMPAVLVESAFLSHKGDARLLKDRTFHQQLAETIYQSIQQWNQL